MKKENKRNRNVVLFVMATLVLLVLCTVLTLVVWTAPVTPEVLPSSLTLPVVEPTATPLETFRLGEPTPIPEPSPASMEEEKALLQDARLSGESVDGFAWSFTLTADTPVSAVRFLCPGLSDREVLVEEPMKTFEFMTEGFDPNLCQIWVRGVYSKDWIELVPE